MSSLEQITLEIEALEMAMQVLWDCRGLKAEQAYAALGAMLKRKEKALAALHGKVRG